MVVDFLVSCRNGFQFPSAEPLLLSLSALLSPDFHTTDHGPILDPAKPCLCSVPRLRIKPRERSTWLIMGFFLEDLWYSIFTPGPTPTLLVATNVTFAALQSLLLALFVATYSIHFFVLSFLSGALWWSINWFARELGQAQAQEAAQKEKEQKKTHADGKPRSGDTMKTPGALDSTESDTETESEQKEKTLVASGPAASSSSASATLQLPEVQEGARKRHSVSGESSGYGSTDSEWEKVDDNPTS